MSDIDNIRELYVYKKMYNHLFNAITNAIEECRDEKVKSKLIMAQQYAEEIYTGENISSKKMTIDEETIVMLLHMLTLQEREKKIAEQDADFIAECEEWISDLEEGSTTQFLLNFEKEIKERQKQV